MIKMMLPEPMAKAVSDVIKERFRQNEKWGPNQGDNLPDGTSTANFAALRDAARINCNHKHRIGALTLFDILKEEYYEAAAEEDTEKLRAELVQVAAVAVKWIECIDKRAGVYKAPTLCKEENPETD